MSEVKILLCDDDPDLLGLLERRLKKMGIAPDVASDGRQAKGFVDKNQYDVIVTDIYMPEATGLEVMQDAKQKDAEVQVVIITSSATLENAIDALNHGAFGYLTKPFDHLIVFDNMVSRALEYRTLLVADRRKAEAQKRRGDMLEDEVEQRVKQLQKTQKGLLDLLGSLPDGILVVEEGGKVVLSSPVGERWLSRDDKTEDRPIHVFLSQVHAEVPESTAEVTIDETDLHLMVADFKADGDLKRKAVIIREVEEDGAGAGSMVTETVMGIKKGLATLYEQGVGTEVVLNVASQFAVLEQLQGWSGGTGDLKSKDSAPAQTPSPAESSAPPPPAQEQSAAPAAAAAGEVTSNPPFYVPRERTPTAELEGPRLNTSELQEALRAAAPSNAQPAAAEPPAKSAPPSLGSQPPEVDPMAQTLVANASQALAEDSVPGAAQAQAEPTPQAEVPAAAKAEPAVQLPVDQQAPIEVGASSEAAGPQTESAELPEAQAVQDVSAEPAPQTPPFKETPSAGPDTQPTGTAAPAQAEKMQASPWEDPEQLSTDSVSDSELRSFPKAESSTGDVPSWVDGLQGTTDPNLLEDFEFEPGRPEASFPASKAGEVAEDDSMFRPRVIPEEMNAKLKTPLELPNPNGTTEYAPPAHEGPITIQASQADTQMFRKVLEGLSGTQVLSGDYEKPPEEASDGKGDFVSDTDESLNELRAKFTEPSVAEPQQPVEPETLLPSPEELRAKQEPAPLPEPVPAKPAQWPPTLPTEDSDWDDELDVSG